MQRQEDNYARAYAQEVILLEKFEEYVKPTRERIRNLEDQILKANLEKTPKNVILLPTKDEIDAFAKEAFKGLENLSFDRKQHIIRNILNKVVASRESLQVYGFINLNILNYQHVKSLPEYRNRRLTKCRQINII